MAFRTWNDQNIIDGDRIKATEWIKHIQDHLTRLQNSQNLSDVSDSVTAFDNIKQDATFIKTGAVELATDPENVAGTDPNRATTPAGLTARLASPCAIGATAPNVGNFTSLNTTTDPVDDAGVGDRAYNDARYKSILTDMTTSSDPAVNAAVTTVIIDTYDGVVISLTAGGNVQTLQTPTITNPGNTFVVVSSDGNGANTITVNGVVLNAGDAQWFIWDGAAWDTVSAVTAADVAFVPYGTITSTNVQAAIQELDHIAGEKTVSYPVVISDLGNSLRMNAATAKIFTLPSMGATEDGERITLSKIGAGRVTIQCVDTDTIGDSSATGSLYCDAAAETSSNVTIEYVHATTNWMIISGFGTWVST
jgi:hypothetical protein